MILIDIFVIYTNILIKKDYPYDKEIYYITTQLAFWFCCENIIFNLILININTINHLSLFVNFFTYVLFCGIIYFEITEFFKPIYKHKKWKQKQNK